jgi:predicted metalloprotease with PDZ domain
MTIQYFVSMNEPERHYFKVKMIITRDSSDKVRLIMPVWTPGSYLVREFARNVLDFKAFEVDTEQELKAYKDSKNSWVIETPADSKTSIIVKYDVYAFEFTVDTSYLDNRHGIINGASVFMYPQGHENEDAILTIQPFEGWSVIATSLEPVSKVDETRNSKSFHAKNFDILVDSPIEIGNQEIDSFNVEGTKHFVSMFGPKPIRSDEFVSDLRKIVETTWRIFGVIPYSRYLFLVDFSGADQNVKGGGLEHLSSTHCIVPRLRLIPKQEYNRIMSLFSHEFFHAWNVKRMRPKGLGPFNYSSETYTRSLWIAEGITSYYDDLILRRSGIFSVPEYFDSFCVNIDHLRFFSGPQYESAEESSFDTWIKHYRPNENTPNVHSSYYDQGAIIGWMLDMEIMKATNNQSNLDAALRRLYNKTFANENRGYEEEEFEEICNAVAGRSFSKEIFDKRVRGHERVDFNKYLGYAGLELGSKRRGADSQPKGYLGIKLKAEGGKATVGTKLFFTPADKCGLAPGDEIIAVDNLRMDANTLPFYVGNKGPGEEISILISRDGYLETLTTRLDEMPQIESRIFKKSNATEEERALFKRWMLASWEDPLEYPDYTPSPQRPKVFDYF